MGANFNFFIIPRFLKIGRHFVSSLLLALKIEKREGGFVTQQILVRSERLPGALKDITYTKSGGGGEDFAKSQWANSGQ